MLYLLAIYSLPGLTYPFSPSVSEVEPLLAPSFRTFAVLSTFEPFRGVLRPSVSIREPFESEIRQNKG